ncbi:hypothetical protein I79_017692 [Cricetulus griseus]|uniref:Uncharacterized protein n=1 Tax=Cricetulus griseus TaxID=10029 RepID=G3I2P9_CRIGR|nr:hypothetical protein I79_017692 [Cricetulus griseus]
MHRDLNTWSKQLSHLRGAGSRPSLWAVRRPASSLRPAPRPQALPGSILRGKRAGR